MLCLVLLLTGSILGLAHPQGGNQAGRDANDYMATPKTTKCGCRSEFFNFYTAAMHNTWMVLRGISRLECMVNILVMAFPFKFAQWEETLIQF